MTHEQVEDIWRLKNVNVKDYTYFSASHKMWSRIDMIWMNKSLCAKIKKAEIMPKLLSDHSPVVCVVRSKPKTFCWRFNEELLIKTENVEYIQKEIQEFLKINWMEEVKNDIVWDTLKAYLRGVLISLGVREKRLRENFFVELQAKIREKERKMKNSGLSKKEMIELKLLQEQMHCILNREIENKIKCLKMKEFIGANKPGKFLAWQLRKRKEKRMINEIKFHSKLTSDQGQIKKAFREFYVKLFEKKYENLGKIKTYLQKVKIKKVPERFKALLKEEITTEEIYEAISRAKSGKAPGPDGFTSKFLKTFKEQLVPYLGEVMNGILKGQDMPSSWREAAITLLPKEGLDKTEVRNYRPISLLNSDYKIFASILASRFKNYLNDYIDQDQVGFLSNRYIKNNLRILMNVLEWSDRQPSKKIRIGVYRRRKSF